MSKTSETINRISAGIDGAIESIKNVSPAKFAVAGVAAVALVTSFSGNLLPNSVKPAHASALPDDGRESAGTASSSTQAETSTNNDTQAEKAVKAAKAENVKALVAKGSSQEAAVAVIDQETNVFFGGDRGEIVGQRPDGACIVATQEGKTVEEFTKTELAVGQTPEQAKEALVAGLCNGENGVNVPAVASFMAQIEAMKNDININADFNKVYTEMTQKYIDAMQESPDAAQAYLETVKAHFANATVGTVEDISGREDHTIYTHDGEEDLTIVAVNVHNRPGTSGVTVTFKLPNNKGVEVTQAIQIGECLQVRIGKETIVLPPQTPTPEAPSVPPATPANPVIPPVTVVPPTSTTTSTTAPTTTNPSTTVVTTTTAPTSTTTSTTAPTTTNPSTTVVTTTTAPDKVTITTAPQPSDPPTTVAESTVPDDTRPDATVAGAAAPSPSIPQQAGEAVSGVVNNAANHPQSAASSFVGVGGLIAYIKRERNKRKGRKS